MSIRPGPAARCGVDAQAGTCRERSASSEAAVKRTVFISTAETLEQFGEMYRVHITDDVKPTGVFELELYDTRAVSVLVSIWSPCRRTPRLWSTDPPTA